MRKILIPLSALLLLGALGAPPARATGTPAGTVISNQAYADYKDANGNAMTRIYSNTVTTTVSQVASVAIVPPTASQSAKNGDVIDYLVQLFNSGNAADTQTFSYASTGWTPTAVQMYYDVNNNHVWDAGDLLMTQTAPNTYKTTVPVPADDDYDVIMRVTVPDSTAAPNGSTDVITITTTSDFDNAKTATGTYTTTVLAAVITSVKTHTPTGTPTRLKPGEIITYTVTLTNSGSIDGTSAVVTDPLPTGLTYVPGSIKVSINGASYAARTDLADNDGIKYDSGTHSVIAPDGATLLNIAAGTSWAVQFQASVDAAVPSDTPLTNQATIAYTSGTSSITVQTNGDTFFVTAAAAIDLASTATGKSGNPGDQVVYPFTVTNHGNADDKVNLATSSTQGWTWVLWVDSNGDGIPGNDGDYLLTDTNGDGKLDTNTLTLNGGSIKLLAVATVPVGAANGATDTVTITGTSVSDVTKTDTQAFTTTVTAPILTVTKGLTAVQAPNGGSICIPVNTTNGSPCVVVPGSTLTYTVTIVNGGAGNATNVVITDIAPNYTTYKPGTIKTGATTGTLTARTDAADGDGAEFSSGSNSIVVPDGSALTLGPTGTWVLQFQVTVN